MKKKVIGSKYEFFMRTMTTIIVITGILLGIYVLFINTVGINSQMFCVDGDKTSNTIKERTQNKESEKIAIVNLDEGVILNDAKHVYANEILRIPAEGDFEFSSLSGAEKGLEFGRYGAYIVVPENFSKTVISVNNELQKCTLQYAINRNVSAETQCRLLQQVFDFSEGLNDDLSYIYLVTILSEFHEAQDIAKTVLSSNELSEEDKKALEIFANKLPYTRKDRLNESTFIEFIVNPLEKEEISSDKK